MTRIDGRMACGLALVVLLFAAPARGAVEIQARVGNRSLSVGESTTLEVRVTGATRDIDDPELGAPPGIEVLSSARAQSFSWVNGRSSSETVFRYEIGASAPGRYSVGPIRVRIAGQVYASPALELTATVAPAQGGTAGRGTGAAASSQSDAASLLVDVTPRSPFVGQPVILRVRLVQRAALAEDPQYNPPTTPGFWGERYRDPESYYAAEGNRRVLVTETRARLYPLVAGRSTIGEADARLALVTSGAGSDPLLWLGGGLPRRDVVVRSQPVAVLVRPLPAGAPEGFDGAVGSFTLNWNVDRSRTNLDVPFTVRLDVRGNGNLPLVHAPTLSAAGVEIFSGGVEDSLGAAGETASGRRRFHWTVLARERGALGIDAPRFAWFDPVTERYRTAQLPPLSIEVGDALFAGDRGRDEFPAVFTRAPLDPGARHVQPWAWGLAGLCAGAAVAMFRASHRPPADSAVRAQQREWLRAVGMNQGIEFWHSADRAAQWVAGCGVRVDTLRRDIESARYGGGLASPDATRRKLIEVVSRALPAARPAWPLRIGAAALLLAGVTLALQFGPQPGEHRDRVEARRADDLARQGDVPSARGIWSAMWARHQRSPELAARLAWSELRAGQLGWATVWVLRGQRHDARDPVLTWVEERVRETGGLVGDDTGRWPIRRMEWSIAALLLGLAAGFAWPRRRAAALGVALAVLCGSAFAIQGALIGRSPRDVIGDRVVVEESGIELEAGQVVRIQTREGARVRVSAGRDMLGWIPATHSIPVE